MSRRSTLEEQYGQSAVLFSQQRLLAHGLSPSTRPWKSGGYSDVYKMSLPNGSPALLRLTICVAKTEAEFKELADLAADVFERSRELMPKRYEFQRFTIPLPNGQRAFIMESVIEMLDALPTREWPSRFSTPRDLLVTLLETGKKLHDRGMLHRDVSNNNILLTRHDGFKFIDNDDACVYPYGVTCSWPIHGTPGYPVAEFDTSEETKRAQMNIAHSNEGSMVAARRNPEYARNHALLVLHNMVHACVIVAFSAITSREWSAPFYEAFLHTHMLLPLDWQAFLVRACTLDVSQRFDFDSVLRAAKSLQPARWETERGRTFISKAPAPPPIPRRAASHDGTPLRVARRGTGVAMKAKVQRKSPEKKKPAVVVARPAAGARVGGRIVPPAAAMHEVLANFRGNRRDGLGGGDGFRIIAPPAPRMRVKPARPVTPARVQRLPRRRIMAMSGVRGKSFVNQTAMSGVRGASFGG